MTPLSFQSNRFFLSLVIMIIAAVGVIIYAGSLKAPFAFDDYPNIVQSPHVRLTEITMESLSRARKGPSPVRPTAYLTFAFNYYYGGYDPLGYHLVNSAIHIINAVLVFLLARFTLALIGANGLLVPLLTALLWLVSPVHTQSVTYIVQRINSMAVMFYLLAFVFYIQARFVQRRRDNPLSPTAVILFFFGAGSGGLALCTKQIAATLPVMIFVYEWFFFQNLDRAWLKRNIRWPAGAAIVLLITAVIYLDADPRQKITAMYDRQDFTMGRRLLTQPQVIAYYLSLLAFPHPARLNLDYDFPVSQSLFSPLTTVPAVLALAALALLAAFSARRQRLPAFAVLWFLGTLAIESSFIGLAMVFEHRTYLPSVFLLIAFCERLHAGNRHRPVAITLLIMMIIAGGSWTVQRNQVWADKITLWQDVADKSPRRVRAWNGLGQALEETGRKKEALACFQKALDLDPTDCKAFNNIGGMLVDLGRPDLAVEYLERSLALNPDYYQAHNNLGTARHRLGRPEQAVAAYQQALAIYPLYEEAHSNLGVTLMEQGRLSEAIACFQEAVRINPGYAAAYNNLGLAESRQGRIDPAEHYYQQAVRLNPGHVNAHFNLGTLYFQKKNLNLAARHLEAALRHDPQSVLAANNLAAVLMARKQYPRAAEVLHHLARLRPDNPDVFYNLAVVYSLLGKTEPALAGLEKAIDLGYGHRDRLLSDPGLDNIRSTEKFRRLKQKLTQKLAQKPAQKKAGGQ